MKTKFLLALLVSGTAILAVSGHGRDARATPAAPAAVAPVYAIQGAKIYTLAGAPIEHGTLLIRDGKIAAVGQEVAVPKGAQVIDAKGLEVYPGIFDAISDLGLTEVGAVSATVDISDVGPYNPQLIASMAVHPSSELIPVARANGITHTLASPGGGSVIAGQASAIHLAGWTVEEMLIRRSVAMVLNWPTIESRTFDFSTFSIRQRPFTEVKREYDRKIDALTEWIERARHYSQALEKGSPEKFDRDLKLEALVPMVRGTMPLLVRANQKRDIKNAVEFCAKQKLKMILAGGADAWEVKDLLKAQSIPVILGPTQALPDEEDTPYDKSFSSPGELHAAGVKIAFASFDASFARRLPYQAANAVPYGLPYEEALRAVTLYPAQILGLADQLGTLEPGKLANLIVTTGDPLAIPTEVRYLFIKGQLTSMENKHHLLYEKYRKRP